MNTDREAMAAEDGGTRAVSWRRQGLALLLFLLAGAAFIGLPVLGSLWAAPYLWPGAPAPRMPLPYDAGLRIALVPALFLMQTLVFPRMTFRLKLTVPMVVLATVAVQGAGLAAWWGCSLLVVAGVLPSTQSLLTFAAVATAALAATGLAVHLLDLAFGRRRRGGSPDLDSP